MRRTDPKEPRCECGELLPARRDTARRPKLRCWDCEALDLQRRNRERNQRRRAEKLKQEQSP